MDSTFVGEVEDAVAAGFDDQCAFLAGLVQTPSTRERQHLVQERVAEAMRAEGYGVDVWTVDPEEIRGHPGFSPVAVSYEHAVNVVGTLQGNGAGRSLILNGHTDVVPAGPRAMWSDDPWSGTIRDGWMYGRGAGDMKAGISANLFAVAALKRLGYRPAATLYSQSVCEEEATGNGALSALVRGYRAEAALISEPTGGGLVRANVGVIWFRLRVRGIPVHVSRAGSGSNAIEAGFHVVQALRGLEREMNAEQGEHAGFADYPHPINFNVGRIEGGDWASSVPAWCDLDCRLALYPDQDPKEVAKRIEATVAEACRSHSFLANNPAEVVWNGFFSRGYLQPEGSEAEAVLARAHGAANGAALTAHAMPAYLDARVFRLYAEMDSLVYGPRAENIHGFDERVDLASLRQVTTAIALFVAEWCGLEKATG